MRLESDKFMKRNRLRSGLRAIVSFVVLRVGGLGISGGFSKAAFRERLSSMNGSLAMFRSRFSSCTCSVVLCVAAGFFVFFVMFCAVFARFRIARSGAFGGFGIVRSAAFGRMVTGVGMFFWTTLADMALRFPSL